VLFITGICSRDCFYCPLSDKKKSKDVIYINERRIHNKDDTAALIDEVRACGSEGVGITGGDPLAKIERTCKYIRVLKKEFGKNFHVHLYTIPESLTAKRLKMLGDAGLDELRLHPDLVNDTNWSRIFLAYDINGLPRYNYKIGIEIPAIPRYFARTKKLIDYFLDKIDFLNINELEIADTESCKLIQRKFRAKNMTSYGVAGSEQLAINLLKYVNINYPDKNVHYCTCKLKDAVQLAKRLKIRAHNTRKVFDIVTQEGTFIRGAIYDMSILPSFDYANRLENIVFLERKKILSRLRLIRNNLIRTYKIPAEMMQIDAQKLRIITNIGIVKKLAKVIKPRFIPAIIEQYPTYDQMEVNVEFL
jgi:pyruvate formate-lyase activating enzyme-like uncharacterized protein